MRDLTWRRILMILTQRPNDRDEVKGISERNDYWEGLCDKEWVAKVLVHAKALDIVGIVMYIILYNPFIWYEALLSFGGPVNSEKSISLPKDPDSYRSTTFEYVVRICFVSSIELTPLALVTHECHRYNSLTR